jgi:hypothetical protein
MGGMRIDAPNSVLGKKKTHASFESGFHQDSLSDVDGAGMLDRYYDTEERIAECQRDSVRKVERHKQKDGYRN